MNPVRSNLIAGIILVSCSLWGYLSSDNPSLTTLIPFAFGLTFLLLVPAFQRGNRLVRHLITVLTAIIFIALFRPLTSVYLKDDILGMIRVIIMLVTCLIALIVYLKSYFVKKT